MIEAGPPGLDRAVTGIRPGALIGRPTWRWFDVRTWGRPRIGVAAVMVVYAVLGTLTALTVPPLLPRDEIGHISYVVSVANGHLPTIYTPLTKGDVPAMSTNTKDTTWVANHPPLFYVLGAVPMRFALALHRPTLGIRLVRLMNVGLVMITMALAAVLARRLVRRSARAPIMAAAATGLVGSVTHTGALAYNDALAMCTAAALVVAAVALFDRGPNARTLSWVAGCASAAALTRFTNFAVIGPAGIVVAAGAWRHGGGSVRRRAMSVARVGVLASLPIALTSGWFYLRNRRLYGDFTGAQALLVMFHRRTQGSARSFLVSAHFWRDIHDEIWTRYSDAFNSTRYGHGWPIRIGRGLTLVLVVGLVCALVRWISGGAVAIRRPVRRWPADLVLGLAAVGQTAVLLVMMAQFAGDGGTAHSRYLFPLLPVIGCFVALAWASLPGNGRGLWSVAAIVAAVGLAGEVWHRFLVRAVGPYGEIDTQVRALRSALPCPVPVLVVLALVLGAALGTTAWALFTLPREQLLRRGRASTLA